jgi:hypothetical protein
MKKNLLTLFLVLCSLFIACATTPQGPDDLDIAIRDTSDYLNDNIPRGNKIVILNIQSDHTALSEYIIDELIANAVNDRVFSVVDRAQLDVIRTELNFQLSGEVSDESALSIGKFLGAQTIVSGAISPLADRHRMRIRALNVETAEVQGQYNRNINTSRTITALMKGGRSTSASYGASTARTSGNTDSPASGTGNRQTAQVATPATLQAGTYTFWPRPQAHYAGRDVACYLDRIVVRGNFITFFLTDRAVGEGSDPEGQWWQGQGGIDDRMVLQDLDNPRRTWRYTERGNVGHRGQFFITYQGVNARRLTLIWNRYEEAAYVFDEIVIGEPD